MAYEKVMCPKCGEEYESLGKHWQYNESHRPMLTSNQKDVITGLMMGDGCLNRSSKNPHLEVRTITKEYLEELDEIFGCLSNGVNLDMEAQEVAKEADERGFSTTVNEENYHDMWRWRTRSLPELHQFDWYIGKNEDKVWPENIKLTPTVLTHWYVGDGHWNNNRRSNRIEIGASNEIGNEGKIDSYFEKANLPTPSNYNENTTGMTIQFTHKQSRKLFEYMESAPSGFEYKFPEEYR